MIYPNNTGYSRVPLGVVYLLTILKEQGHDITAFYIKIWLQDEFSFLGDCPWEEDLDFATAVCKQADVPLEVLPLQTEYWENVVSYTIAEIKEGRTPNPDMLCNLRIKFGAFYDRIDASFEKVATGHYAQVEEQKLEIYIFATDKAFTALICKEVAASNRKVPNWRA